MRSVAYTATTLPTTSSARNLDFKTEYHPDSKRSTKIEAWDKFRNASHPPPALKNDALDPWEPFKSKGDCEFASIAIDAKLTQANVERLLALIGKVAKGNADVTFKNDAELRKTCDQAALELTPITVDWKKQKIPIEVHKRDLLEWAKELLGNKSLAPHFEWDAQRVYRRDEDSGRFVRMYDEPWTADRWWNIQTKLPNTHTSATPAPFSILLYADKTRLSSFGTIQGYPVIARCMNLPTQIRNGNGIGGARVVGWLPVLGDDPEKEGKLSYTNFKHVVWHKSFKTFIEDIGMYLNAGMVHDCYDGQKRILFPAIFVLSANYEEQCMMALIRGPKCKCPCPICLSPKEKLRDFCTKYKRCTSEQGRELYEKYKTHKGLGNDAMKEVGLRPAENVFWDIQYSDPHDALLFDRLHFNHGGLFSRHLLPELQKIIKHVSSKLEGTMGKFDEQIRFDKMPRWRDLNHFAHAVNTSFSDGNKFHDMSKQILFAAQNLLTPRTSPEGYALLLVIRSYLELNCYIGLDVHTDDTIAAGEAELNWFSNLLDDYIELAKISQVPDIKVDWDFPKAHYLKHAFEDIRNKGASRNYSTRPNEGVHTLLKAAYGHTNGKEIAEQILRIDQHRLAINLIFSRIAEHEAALSAQDESADSDTAVEYSSFRSSSEKFYVGSSQPITTIANLQSEHPQEPAFRDLHNVLEKFVNETLPNLEGMEEYKTQLISWQRLGRSYQEFRFVKVNYESRESWLQTTDYLHCHPNFHHHPRYDCALVQISDTEEAFVRLIFVFQMDVAGVNEPLSLALVQPYTAGLPGLTRRVDKDLGLIRVKATPRASSIIIPLGSIIRGALLAPDFGSTDCSEFFVMAHIDGDMFLRMKEWSR
ncbi:hypothetical protein CONPUDRAFT_90680 [Coniophora puteana RWD-64-598 SS2]|uniref:Uncharacterized protein n=1 Tax=Coniophora puteana (strain RWD-64-598) TaxID=741705 RepID=A0A5M3MPD1_CONPW|nr:uncharacterized protein CONPUDRAFT_90680 [Coniophora puteana RWD-64-598 SS2]EIW80471.1 hypothetical protein CONPUDRAFT_90680 [Coniophora puteana RWD-64-598 SS2]